MAADIEFLSLVESTLLDGNVASMSVLHETYVDIYSANNVASASCARKKVKKLIECEIPNVEFHKANCVNPLDAGRRLTDFSQTSYAAGSRLTYCTVNQRSGSVG